MMTAMPELPDVEIFRRRFAAKGLRRLIDAVDVRTPRVVAKVSPNELKRRLIGGEFKEARRYGKRLYVGLQDGEWMSLHFGLSGELKINKREDEVPGFARVIIDLSDGHRLSYTNRRMIGRIELVRDPRDDVRAKGLGPDALDSKLTASAFYQLLHNRKGGLKNVLMDQSIIAGIGNAYSDEILFQARLHPAQSPAELNKSALSTLYRILRQVLRQAIAAHADPARLPRHFLIPHRRSGAKCPRCDGSIERYRVGERHGYFCPSCQRQRTK
jgi:formamidopyrimidine-DNA glycosylase